VVDRYLAEYEDDKIDRETVARRIEKISPQIRQLRHQRGELAFLLDLDAETPIRDRVHEITDAGTGPERDRTANHESRHGSRLSTFSGPGGTRTRDRGIMSPLL
jgi:hypothetical protein